jgi:hypothetical protein
MSNFYIITSCSACKGPYKLHQGLNLKFRQLCQSKRNQITSSLHLVNRVMIQTIRPRTGVKYSTTTRTAKTCANCTSEARGVATGCKNRVNTIVHCLHGQKTKAINFYTFTRLINLSSPPLHYAFNDAILRTKHTSQT